MRTKKQRKGFRAFEEGNKCYTRSQFADAAKHFQRALNQDRNNPDLMFHLGACYCNINQNQKGLALLKKSVSLAGDDGKKYWNYSSFLFFAGHFEEAKAAMRKAISIMPEKVVLLYNYCNMAKPDLDDPAVMKIRELIREDKLSKRGLSFAYYGLAKVYEGIKDYETAWDYAIKGGAAYGVECNLDDQNVDRIIRANTAQALRREPRGGDMTEAPVFIVGMPRSGTTFTETVLSCHPDVLGAGELSGARIAEILSMTWASQNAPIANAFEHIRHTPPQLEEVAAGYLMSQVTNMAQGQPYKRFTDKLPEDVFRLGFISRMYPNARVIVIHRHPLDNCSSCLFQRFNDIQYSYSNTIETLAVQYKAYQRVLAHWREVLPLQMMEINYQLLVTDFEAQAKRLVEFIGLPWDEACLDPGGSDRTVKTATAGQIRDGVNTKSVDRWKRYGDRITPLVEALGGMAQIEAWAAQGMTDASPSDTSPSDTAPSDTAPSKEVCSGEPATAQAGLPSAEAAGSGDQASHLVA
ncbi:MAG: sulfotransferase [Pseudomonadota bacterium]